MTAPQKPTAGQVRLAPSMESIIRVLNMARELTCTAKRVYFADVVSNHDGTGSYASAAQLGLTLGLTGDQVEYARRSLVEDQLQLIVERATGRTSGRICVFPRELDPGPDADEARCMAAAILLDGYLLKNRRGDAPTTTPKSLPLPGGVPRHLQVHR